MVSKYDLEPLPFTEIVADIQRILSRLETTIERIRRDLEYYSQRDNASKTIIAKYDNQISVMQDALEFVGELINRLHKGDAMYLLASFERIHAMLNNSKYETCDIYISIHKSGLPNIRILTNLDA